MGGGGESDFIHTGNFLFLRLSGKSWIFPIFRRMILEDHFLVSFFLSCCIVPLFVHFEFRSSSLLLSLLVPEQPCEGDRRQRGGGDPEGGGGGERGRGHGGGGAALGLLLVVGGEAVGGALAVAVRELARSLETLV